MEGEEEQVHYTARKVSMKREGIPFSPGHADSLRFNLQGRSQAAQMEDDEQELLFPSHQEKKRRLRAEQVQFLEKSFEIENRLEPERKALLAKEAGLQERQVAVWFQNRRARYRTKVLEKDYYALKARFQTLKADYDALVKENEEMRNEIILLSEKMNQKGEKLKQEESNEVKLLLEPLNGDPLDFDLSQTLAQDEKNKSTPKLEFEWDEYLQPNCCNLGFPVRNQGTWFWKY